MAMLTRGSLAPKPLDSKAVVAHPEGFLMHSPLTMAAQSADPVVGEQPITEKPKALGKTPVRKSFRVSRPLVHRPILRVCVTPDLTFFILLTCKVILRAPPATQSAPRSAPLLATWTSMPAFLSLSCMRLASPGLEAKTTDFGDMRRPSLDIPSTNASLARAEVSKISSSLPTEVW